MQSRPERCQARTDALVPSRCPPGSLAASRHNPSAGGRGIARVSLARLAGIGYGSVAGPVV